MRSILPMMFLLVVTTAPAEVYRWVDDEGTVHFSDTPREPGNTQRVDVDGINTAKSVEVESVTTDTVADEPAEVVMYSASWCGTCDLAREYFLANDIPFKEYDVEDTRKGQQDFAAMGGKAVPIILVGESKMVGFSPTRFEQLYEA